MLYEQIFEKDSYPNILNTLDNLNVSSLPPWDFIREKYSYWKKDFDNAGLKEYCPFARMINDDVIATFKKDSIQKVYLFTVPIEKNKKPFQIYDDFDIWLKKVTEDLLEYLVNY